MIRFIEESHQYLDEQGRELISVSKFTDQFKEKTDWNKVASNVAKRKSKEGETITTQEVLQEWAKKRDFSAAVGTILHADEENKLLSQSSININNVDCNVYKYESTGDYKTSFPIETLQNNMIYPELMIYDLENMICGQSDKVVIINNTINIYDYKTDKEISFVGYSNKWKSAKCYLPPLSHLEECNGNTYSLKMSLYMYMIWKANKGRLKPGKIILEHVHLKRDEDGYPEMDDGFPIVTKREVIELPYRRREVIDMLKTKL